MMRHYSLVPVRYNEQQLLVPCPAEYSQLWSIVWHAKAPEREKPEAGAQTHWFADCSPLEYETATALVHFLNYREHAKHYDAIINPEESSCS